ncbi:MAG TPA: squalene/phytoene synthase family protein [Solirubrobacteraceae bacterium]|nr:squalene/phytoene synthase family protein [Solirubrobacteraceae bacterium]
MSAGTAIATSEAYDRCERITRAQAANFYYGIRLLPRERRRAMCAAYAFARRIDDIGDGGLPREQKLSLLERSAAQLAELERSGAAPVADPVLVALADAHRRFSLPAGALGELIEGVRMDVEGVSYERFEDLVLYCRRVAGAIGRVCLAIFAERGGGGQCELEPGHIERLADDLGVALQLTNILRDVREDAENGRVYLPAEDLRRFGVATGAEGGRAPGRDQADGEDGGAAAMALTARRLSLLAAEQGGSLAELMRFEAERAQQWFDRGLALVPLLDRRSAACVSAMAGIYHRLLERIEADPAAALRARASLSGREKLLVALRSIAGRGA